jgi:hypothetical protein
MNEFKHFLDLDNIDEMNIFLKNSKVDLLKTIAKRYKISGSSKKKDVLIPLIIKSIQDKKTFQNEPSIHQMTISQLKNKARELNIDISGILKKQDLRLAILNKMNPQSNLSISKVDELNKKTLEYIKTLAKSYKIKISKLSKKQLITSILQAQKTDVSSDDIINKDIEQKDIHKMLKTELILLAQKLNIENYKGKSKKDLIQLILTNSPDLKKKDDLLHSDNDLHFVESIPISQTIEKKLISNKKFTVAEIKKELLRFKIDIPKIIKKRNDLIHLFVISTSTITTTPPPPPPPSPNVTPTPPPPSPKKKKSLTITIDDDGDIVDLNDISTPFSPPPIHNLLDEPNPKLIQDELIRCLQFYEYPK